MRIAAIDLGTSSTRALVFEDARFTGIAASVETALAQPEPGAALQDANEVLAALVQCLKRVRAAGPIDCVALSSAMHSLLALDAGGQALTPAFTWADNRAAPAATRLRDSTAGADLYRRTGVPLHPMAPLSKLVWLKQSAPQVFERAARFVSLKEFVVHRLFGQWLVDPSIAGASGLYDLETGDWCEAALAACGVGRERLSRIVAPTTLLSGLAPDIAHATGVDAATPFMLGASDGCLANLGAGLLAADTRRRAVLTIGTSGALRMAVPSPAPDAAMRTFCYRLDQGEFVIGGATNGGGLPLRWLRDNFAQLRAGLAGDDPYAVLSSLAEQAPVGAQGLLFHPYLAGERAPLWNAHARASFIGLTFAHGPAHLVRAVMEGVLFNLAMILDVLEELAGGPVDEVLAGGGFAKSSFWLTMAADLFGRDLLVADNPESTAQGAALMALKATGRVASLAQAVALLPVATRRLRPDPARHARYAHIKRVYATLPATLAPLYPALAELGRAP
ncbi:MAG: gluconokinase [Burkholderiales bacterium]|nr:gluconokinase [Burkholderiales bacterium]